MPLRTAREAAVELGVDVRRHIDAVDDQSGAGLLEQPGIVDFDVLGVGTKNHQPGNVGALDPRSTQIDPLKAGTAQIVGSVESCHHARSKAVTPDNADTPPILRSK